VTTSAGRHRLLAAVLALVPALIVLACHLILARGVGQVDEFGSVGVYRAVMNAAALGRFFGLFAAVVLVWGLLRTWQAPRWVLALAVLSGPLMYAVTAVIDVVGYFPTGQALYYGLNPLTIAGIGAQSGTAALCEAGWRWWQRRHSRRDGPVLTFGLVAVVVVGYAVLYFAVLFRGGVAYFFIYQQGYLLLFT
jgi:hypothetical protein